MTRREQEDDCPPPGGGKTALFSTSQQTDGVGHNVSSAEHGSISCHIHYLLTRAASSQ